jgi:hypothetical protein
MPTITTDHPGFGGAPYCYELTLKTVELAYAFDPTVWTQSGPSLDLSIDPKPSDFDARGSYADYKAMPRLPGSQTMYVYTGSDALMAYPMTIRMEIIPRWRRASLGVYPFFSGSLRLEHHEIILHDGVIVEALKEVETHAWQSWQSPIPQITDGVFVHHQALRGLIQSFIYRDITLGEEGEAYYGLLNVGITAFDPSVAVRTEEV